MRKWFRRFCLVLLGLGLWSTSAWAQQTGTLSGVVRDAQGARACRASRSPSSSPALIGGARTTPTGATGTYQLTGLPPGTYTVDLRAHRLHAAQARGRRRPGRPDVTRLDVELAVGTLQETVTVSGESPVVDVSSTVTQTNITKDLYDAIPTGPQSVGHGGPRARRRHRPARRRRHRRACSSTTSKRSARPTARSRSRSTASRPTGAAAAAARRCSTTASRCTRNTTCRRRRAPRRAMSAAST